MVVVADVNRCSGCFLCCLSCSYSNTPEHEFNVSKSMIKVTSRVDGGFDIEVTPECFNCDICVDYCYYDVLTRGEEV